jgi:hypothetical protein
MSSGRAAVVLLCFGVVTAFSATAVYPLFIAPERRGGAAPAVEPGADTRSSQRRDYVPVLRQDNAPLHKKSMWQEVAIGKAQSSGEAK